MRLSQLAALPLQTVQRLDSDKRYELLEHYHAQRAEQRTTERDALWQRIHAAIEHQAHPPGEQP